MPVELPLSYVIHIWDQPTPASWTQAQALLERLAKQAAPANPRFAKLAQGLQASFPALGTAWTLDSPDGVLDEAVWSLGLESGLLPSLYPRLIDQALALGLCVLDEQTGECFVPGPYRLSAAGVQPLDWKTPARAAAPASSMDVQGRFRALVLPRLAAHGFELEAPPARGNNVQTLLHRATPLGRQTIQIEWAGIATSHYDVTIFCAVTPPLPPPLAELCAPQTMLQLRIAAAPMLDRFLFGYHATHPTSREYRVVGSAELDDLLLAIAAWLIVGLVPVLDECSSIDGFLAYDLGEPREPVGVMPYMCNLAVAHAAGAQDVPQRFLQLLHRRELLRIPTWNLEQLSKDLSERAADTFGVFKREAS